jgi:hypothetical protein
MSTFPYIPGVFATLAASQLGIELWTFLNSPESRLRMSTASDLGRPALEAVEELLLDRFGKQVLEDRTKQMIGHMARQVMEHEGYVIDAKDVKMMGGAPFARATRYKRPDAMVFHVWRNSDDILELAVTAYKSETRLPAPTTGVWLYWKSFEGNLRLCVSLGITDVAKARREIESKGHHLHRMERMMRAGRNPINPS